MKRNKLLLATCNHHLAKSDETIIYVYICAIEHAVTRRGLHDIGRTSMYAAHRDV